MDDARADALRTSYLSALYQRAGRVEFGNATLSNRPDQTPLTLDQVYTALRTSTVEGRDELCFDGLTLLNHVRAQHQLSAVEQLDRHQRLVLLGAPGSGKSAFVNFVALCLAGELLGKRPANLAALTAPLPRPEEAHLDKAEKAQPQPWTHGALLPVRVVLRNLAATHLPAADQPANVTHLLNHIGQQLTELGLADFAQPLLDELRQAGGLLLLDGLDEVPEADARRAQIRQMVESFAATFPACRMVVTSRTYAYQQAAWRLEGFTPALLEPFDEAQIVAFVDRWYSQAARQRDLTGGDARGRAELLKQTVLRNSRLYALAEQPLLLTLMANLHAYRGSLPNRREQLYKEAVDLLLDWWEQQRVVRDDDSHSYRVVQPSLLAYLDVGKERMLATLAQLAFDAHARVPDHNQRAAIEQSKLLAALFTMHDKVDVRQLIDYLEQRAGLLVAEGGQLYAFPHRTFQEYLAALHLAQPAFYPDELARLAREQPQRWREVLLLAGAAAAGPVGSDLWALAEALCYREPTDAEWIEADAWGAQLAGQLLTESATLSPLPPRHKGKLERVQRGLVHVVEQSQLPALERALAGRSLAQLGDPRPHVMTVEAMHFCSIPPGPFLNPMAEHRQTELPYAYWMARYPVTQAQYAHFVAAGGYEQTAFWAEAIEAGYWDERGFKGQFDDEPRTAPYQFDHPYDLPNHPVVGITWYEAMAFCAWLTATMRANAALPNDYVITLPLDADWRKAAVGGLQIPATAAPRPLANIDWSQPVSAALIENSQPQRRYPWGEAADADLANVQESEIGSTSAAGSFGGGASPYGVEELSGNVYEWLLQKPGDLAGGAFWRDAEEATSAARDWSDPLDGSGSMGFRCVVVPSSR
ncbi:MAG: SUMF1/EgtB/PvdO family nonheme iron enzyme [Caldilineaceae bacterium]|nr:SUMF1/EgtB/PvdO family nonheme iron enzyme [Caldilineaceae bacterium]